MKVFLRRILFVCLAMLPAATAQAGSITFWFVSNYPEPVSLEFSSADEPDRFWPGYGQSYPLNDYDQHSFQLTCRTGERVCWGAWVPNGGVRWGRGYRADRH